ncbi:hypothetical protein [Helicobacter rodentium]|uniref:hypothetical protein n=1 Tax=Helicobacter rodentium TaxID=59617 RepID=UPI002557DAAD|nr:hypothetical protein [Helicobacter rodentium]
MRECVAFAAIHNPAYIKLYNSKLLRFHCNIFFFHYYRLPRFHKWNLAMTKWLAFQFILYYRFALKRVKMLRICTPRKFCKFSRNDILPPRHCEALAEAIHNTESRL